MRVLNYLQNRLTGKARGGEFRYRVLDEDGEERDEADLPFSFSASQTLLSGFREEFSDDGGMDVAHRLTADTYIFADAPATQQAAARLGHDAFRYQDVFEGGPSAARDLLGIDIADIACVEDEQDLQGEWVPSHDAVRPLAAARVERVWARPAAELADERRLELQAAP